MKDCVIFFLYHRNDEITNFHLEQFRKYNPYFDVIPLNPNSYPKSNLWSYQNMWMHNDTMIYDWIDSRDFIRAKRYCWFDWDTLCEQSADEYYGDYWDADIAGTHVYDIHNNSSWQWFNHAKKYKNLSKYFNELRGISPFCGMIISKDSLEISFNRLKKENLEWREQNNEVRLATCAHLEGVKLSTLNRNTIQPFSSNIGNKGKIFHPVKIKKSNMVNKKLEKFEEIFIVSPAFSTTDEIIRDLNSSREVYKNWNVNFIGRGQKMESYVYSKIFSLKEYLDLNKGMFEWLLMIDSNDTLFIRNFGPEIKSILESFGKPIIFSGEANCYPLKELEGLYTSDSKIKYLNSGVIAIRKDFIKPLFDHVTYLYENYPQYKTIGYNPPGDQTYYSLCLFSKELGNNIAIDEKGLLSVSTAFVPDSYFSINNGELMFNNSKPYILHCQGNDKHGRKRSFMKKMNIPVRG